MGNEKPPPSRLPRRPEAFDGLPPSPYWPSFVEKLLLALIDAHPGDPHYRGAKTPDDARQLRLADALMALFGAERSAGASAENDLARLMEIARRRLAKESVRAFANEVLELSDEELGADALPGAFAGDLRATDPDAAVALNRDRVRLSRKYRNEGFQDYAFHVLTFREHDEERAMLNDLALIGDILARWNVALSIEPMALGMASPAYATPRD